MIPLNAIQPFEDWLDETQIRHYLRHPEEIFRSLSPVRVVEVRPGLPFRYYCLDGAHRLYACFLRGVEDIPIEPELDLKDEEGLVGVLLKNRAKGLCGWSDLSSRIISRAEKHELHSLAARFMDWK